MACTQILRDTVNERAVRRILLGCILVTGHKVMFLQVCVILFTGGRCLPQCMLGYHTPPGADTPQEPDTPPGTKYTPPARKQTPAYGQRAAGTHPTGMHSCLKMSPQPILEPKGYRNRVIYLRCESTLTTTMQRDLSRKW